MTPPTQLDSTGVVWFLLLWSVCKWKKGHFCPTLFESPSLLFSVIDQSVVVSVLVISLGVTAGPSADQNNDSSLDSPSGIDPT